MSRLKDLLISRIRAAGPMTVAEYMTTCLMHPEDGYYTTRDPFGAKGDFITAPDISQMFGELVGLALAQSWMDRGAPTPFNLVELGPGRGTLMADIMRATKHVQGFHEGAQLHLIEGSLNLKAAQKGAIKHPLTHHDSFESVPAGPVFLIANEFFDALPIRQFLRDGDGWRERVIGIVDEVLAFGLSDPMKPELLNARLADTKNGDLVETSTSTTATVRSIGQRIFDEGGVAYIFDYGSEISLGDTFQALKAHKKIDPLETPGMADLTAHVDFGALALASHPAATSASTPQGMFLERLGITERARALAANLEGQPLDTHIAAHRRLTHAAEMGTLFKVIALFAPDTPIPPGVSM
ncbi:MAG: class I SAM-dependent methyltransferase [Boseongicola sp.]|nr:MAG: class I SAM-dependent methyltransferase [Boseongicola sp.]